MFKILVVEDDRDLNKTVCSFLNNSGYEATGCLGAEEAYDVMYDDFGNYYSSPNLCSDPQQFDCRMERQLSEKGFVCCPNKLPQLYLPSGSRTA